MVDELKNRFRRVKGFQNGNGHVELEIPTERQAALIQKSLSGLAPWLPCDTAGPFSHSLLETFFNKESKKSEWERSHVLADPACGGLPRLVNEYNATYGEGSAMRLDDPESKLRSPKFDDDMHSPSDGNQNGGPSDPGGRFNPPPLTHNEISSIKHSFERNQKRRKNYQHSAIRVLVDGEELASCTQSDSLTSFALSNMASSIEVFGEDADGELLLAVFPLLYLEAADSSYEQKFHVTHEGGQNISLTISPPSEPGDDTGESLAWIEYSEPGHRHGVIYQTAPNEEELSFQTLLLKIIAGEGLIEDLLAHSGFQRLGKQICASMVSRYDKSMRMRCGVSYEAEDLFSDVYIKIVNFWHEREARGERPDKSNFPNGKAFSQWVSLIARNLVIDELRKFKKHQEDGETPVFLSLDNIDLANDDDVQLEKEILLRQFLEFTETLSANKRRATELWLEGYSYRKIMIALNDTGIKCSHATVHRWIKSSLKAFAQGLKRNEEGSDEFVILRAGQLVRIVGHLS